MMYVLVPKCQMSSQHQGNLFVDRGKEQSRRKQFTSSSSTAWALARFYDHYVVSQCLEASGDR